MEKIYLLKKNSDSNPLCGGGGTSVQVHRKSVRFTQSACQWDTLHKIMVLVAFIFYFDFFICFTTLNHNLANKGKIRLGSVVEHVKGNFF